MVAVLVVDTVAGVVSLIPSDASGPLVTAWRRCSLVSDIATLRRVLHCVESFRRRYWPLTASITIYYRHLDPALGENHPSTSNGYLGIPCLEVPFPCVRYGRVRGLRAGCAVWQGIRIVQSPNVSPTVLDHSSHCYIVSPENCSESNFLKATIMPDYR